MTEDHQPLPETEIGEKTYFHAVPGTQYYVKINVYKNPSTNQFPAKYLRFGLYVDGIDVQYWKRLDLNVLSNNQPNSSSSSSGALCVSSHFYGFKKNHEELRSFKIDVPSTLSGATNSFDNSSSAVGSIKVVVYAARVTEGVYDNRGGYHEIPNHHQISEHKKFWQQASVATTGGTKISSDREKFNPLIRWENLTKDPIETILCYYHSPGTILLLKDIYNSMETPPLIGKRRIHDLQMSRLDSRKKSTVDMLNDSSIGSKYQNTEGPNEGDDDASVETVPDVSLVVKPKVVQMCDLTKDGDIETGGMWSTKIIR